MSLRKEVYRDLFPVRLSPTYVGIIEQLLTGPKTVRAICKAVHTLNEDTARIRIAQLRLRMEPVGWTISRMKDGPRAPGEKPRTYRLLRLVDAQPEQAEVVETVNAKGVITRTRVTQEIDTWEPDF